MKNIAPQFVMVNMYNIVIKLYEYNLHYSNIYSDVTDNVCDQFIISFEETCQHQTKLDKTRILLLSSKFCIS